MFRLKHGLCVYNPFKSDRSRFSFLSAAIAKIMSMQITAAMKVIKNETLSLFRSGGKKIAIVMSIAQTVKTLAIVIRMPFWFSICTVFSSKDTGCSGFIF